MGEGRKEAKKGVVGAEEGKGQGRRNWRKRRGCPPPPALDLPQELLHRCFLRQLRPPILSPSCNRKAADKQDIFQCFVQAHVYRSPSGTPTLSLRGLVSNLTNFTAAGE